MRKWARCSSPNRRTNEKYRAKPVNYESDPSSDDGSDYRRGGNGSPATNQLCKILSNLKIPKEVVSPGTFSGKDGTSFRKFLDDYEVYFETKYEGNERQQYLLLGRFLEGPARRAYDAIDGSRTRYSYLRSELLQWYKGEKSSLRNRCENEFRKAKMNADDNLKIYALRLERLASHAFSESSRDRDRQLCRKFWKTVPEHFHRVLSDGEKSLALHGRGNKLDWKEMVRLAASEDRFRRERREERSSESEAEKNELSVWYSRPSDPPRTPQRDHEQRRTTFSRKPSKVTFRSVYNNSQIRSPPFHDKREQESPKKQKLTGGNKQPLICNWCGKRGHIESSC